jgi:hypothetical protein
MQHVAVEREAEQLGSDDRPTSLGVGEPQFSDRSGDEVVELGVELLGDSVVGHRGAEQEHEGVFARVVLPALNGMADHGLAACASRGPAEVGDLQVRGRRRREQPGL